MGNALSDCNNSQLFNFTNEKNTISSKYFDLIKKIQKTNYIANSNNSSNIAMSLDKKGFTTTITSTRRVINITQDIRIDWLQFLYYYLFRQVEKGKPWAQPALNRIQNEIFLYENEFQSEVFFKEFEIITKPTPVIKASEKIDQTDSLFQDMKKKRHKTSLTRHFGGSFYNDNVKQEIIPGDPAMEYKYIRQQIKQYVSCFNKQVQDPGHPIKIITIILCEEFSEYAESIINNLTLTQEDYEEKLLSDTKTITLQLQKIIIKLQMILKLFYSTTLNYGCFTEEKDEVINIIASIVFNQNCIYNSMFKLYQISEGNRVKSLEKKFRQYKNIHPEELNIDVKFRLDLSTLEYQKELLLSSKAKMQTKEILLDPQETIEIIKGIDEKMLLSSSNNSLSLKVNMTFEETIPNQSCKGNQNVINIDTKSYTDKLSINTTDVDSHTKNNATELKRIEKKTGNWTLKGYNSAIKLFDSIKEAQTPFEKMLMISRISEKITSSVNWFWKDMMPVITSEFLFIEVDTLMEIFIYLLIKSQMTDLPIHMQMIKFFTTNTTKTSMIGYYYTTLDAALNYIETIKMIDKNDIFD